MSLELIAYHAAHKPRAIAMIDAWGTAYSYDETRREIIALARKLDARFPNLRQLQPIGVAYPDKRWHFLLTLALEALGVTTLPFVQPIDAHLAKALAHCGMVLAGDPLATATIPVFALEQDWLESSEGPLARAAEAPFTPHRFLAEDIVSILVTSGSAGAPKCIPLHQRARDLREYNRIWRYEMGPGTRFLVALPISVTTVNILARAALRCGGAVEFWREQQPSPSLDEITHATFLPAHLTDLMTAIAPAPLERRERLKLYSIGAALGPALRKRASAHFHADIFNLYGCNELGGCASIDEDGVAHVLPGVQFEIVDEQMRPLGFGQPGAIRARSDEMALGYLDAATTREKFVDGWFMTGDTGVMLAPRLFRLSGRADYMVNVGGVKISPDEIEDALTRAGLARDLAVCTLANGDGIDELYIAAVNLVKDSAGTIKTLSETIGPNFGHVRIVLLQRIPRSGSGKIQRAQLVEDIEQVIERQAQSSRPLA